MATVNFISIKPYPYYKDLEGNFSEGMAIVNINKNSKGGSFTIHLNDVKDLYDFNYVVIAEEYSKTIYGWIEDWVRERNGMFTVNYKIDAFRTFKNNINFGLQYVTRLDGLGLDSVKPIGSIKDPMIKTYGLPYETIHQANASPDGNDGNNTRYAVIQVRGRSYVGGVDVSAAVNPSNNPLNPSQYRLYVSEYKLNNPNGTSFALNNLLTALRNMAETSNIVTMYSVPFINGYGQLLDEELVLRVGDKPEQSISGFKVIGEYDDIMPLQTFKTSIDLRGVISEEFLTSYGDGIIQNPYQDPGISDGLNESAGIDFLNGDTAQLITPEGQVLNIPPSVIKGITDYTGAPFSEYKSRLRIERIVDLYSGSVSTHIGDEFLTPYSVRSGPLGEITILSDPKDSYLAQNKTSRAVGLATTIGGGILAATTGGVSLAASAAMLGPTANSLIGTAAGIADSGNNYSSQPLFLGETTGAKYNNLYHLVITTHHKEFTGKTYGRPFEEALELNILQLNGVKGYIQTHQCKVESGTAPLWAIDEINTLLDSGVFFNKE